MSSPAAPKPDSPQRDHTRRITRVTAEQLAALDPVRATHPMPEDIKALLRNDASAYLRATHDGKITLTERRIDDTWARVTLHGGGTTLLGGLPGLKQAADAIAADAVQPHRTLLTEPHRPAWLDLEYVPRLVPFRLTRVRGANCARLFTEPVSAYHTDERANEALRFIYPWRTIGQVLVGFGTDFTNVQWSGTGVLVGRNLVLTASHVAPWNRGPGQWWMRFVPGRRINDEPHGSSYVESFYGSYEDPNDFEASGWDYVICKLYTPLGDALGWMGTRSFASEDDYYRRRYISVGYPGYFGDKPAVEYDIDIDDIDNDGAGLELETSYDNSPLGDGWSGGPLWMWENEKPYVVGILSGNEKDELDPRRYVFGGGGLLVDRVKYGLANFA